MTELQPPLSAFGWPHLAASWLLIYLLHSTAITCGALLAAGLVRKQAALRCWIWRIALLLPFATATAVSYRSSDSPARSLSISEFVRPTIAGGRMAADIDVKVVRDAGGSERREVSLRDPAANSVALVLCGLLAAGALASLALLMLRQAAARRQLGGRTMLSPDVVVALAGAPVPRGVRFSALGNIVTPLALLRREICLPFPRMLELSPAERRSVVLHELAHVERRDAAWSLLAQTAAVLGWCQPLNRIIARRHNTDAEFAADRAAIVRGGEARAMVSALATFAAVFESGRVRAFGVPLVQGASPVVERAERLLLAPQLSARRALLSGLAALLLLCAAARAPFLLPPLTTAPAVASAARVATPGGAVIEVEKDSVVELNPTR